MIRWFCPDLRAEVLSFPANTHMPCLCAIINFISTSFWAHAIIIVLQQDARH
jgi:hypothetical protein